MTAVAVQYRPAMDSCMVGIRLVRGCIVGKRLNKTCALMVPKRRKRSGRVSGKLA